MIRDKKKIRRIMNIKEYQGSYKKHNKDTKKSNYEPTMNINGNVKGKYKPSQYNS